MMEIKLLEETPETVTLRRADFERLLEAAHDREEEDREDIAALRHSEENETRIGKDAARADHLSGELVEALIDGAHPVAVWRRHRGMNQLQLARKAGIGRSYLSDIERGARPGSIAAIKKLGRALDCTAADLLREDVGGDVEQAPPRSS